MNYDTLLRYLEKVVNVESNFNSDKYLECLLKIDNFNNDNKLNPQLKHYLSQRSYKKAYDYVKNNI